MNRGLGGLLPTSRKARLFLVVLVIAAALILIKSLFFRPAGQRPPVDEGLVLKLHQDQLEKLREDSDGDGLKNWEEILYHTDVMNADTDGDGTSDGQEVNQNRDPAKKGPDDHFATSTPLGMTSTSKDPETNYTRDFTRTFLRGPVSQIVAGGKAAVDIKAVARYADKLSQKSILSDAPRFTMADIHISSMADAAMTIQYLLSVKKIFTALDARGKNEVLIVVEALRNQDYTELIALTTYSETYQRALNDLRVLPTPKNFAEYHLALLNYLSLFKRSVELMQKTETDPVLTILTLNERLSLEEGLTTYLTSSKEKILAGLEK